MLDIYHKHRAFLLLHLPPTEHTKFKQTLFVGFLVIGLVRSGFGGHQNPLWELALVLDDSVVHLYCMNTKVSKIHKPLKIKICDKMHSTQDATFSFSLLHIYSIVIYGDTCFGSQPNPAPAFSFPCKVVPQNTWLGYNSWRRSFFSQATWLAGN